MRELKFNTGGRPLFNDDIKILQEDVYVALTGLLKGLRKNVIISGFEASLSISSGSRGIDFKPGLVFLDNEILRFSGAQGLRNSGIIYIVKDTEIKPPLDSRTYNDGVEKPAITENIAIVRTTEPAAGVPFIRLSINDISFQGVVDAGVDVDVDNYHDEANEHLSNFIKANIGGLDKCILNGLTTLRDEIRTTNSSLAGGSRSSFVVDRGASIFYNGEVYFVLAETITYYRDAELKFVHLDKDRKLVRLVEPSDNGELLVTFNELEYYDALRKNQLFPAGTILHIRLNQKQFEDSFPERTFGVNKWHGWEVDQFSRGRVILGHNTHEFNGTISNSHLNDTELFDTEVSANNSSGKTHGGEREVQLSKAQIPRHVHGNGDLKAALAGKHYHEIKTNTVSTNWVGSGHVKTAHNDDGLFGTVKTSTTPDGAHDHDVTGSTGDAGSDVGGGFHENMPPYVVYLTVVKVDPS